MEKEGFAARVAEHLEPVLAPRGFSSQGHGGNDSAVLFHCDGPAVEEALERFPTWREPLFESYGNQFIPCLDLWVQHDGESRSWTFEIFDTDVAAAAGAAAMQRLEDLQDAPVDEWAVQLARVLEAYFAELEKDGTEPRP